MTHYWCRLTERSDIIEAHPRSEHMTLLKSYAHQLDPAGSPYLPTAHGRATNGGILSVEISEP